MMCDGQTTGGISTAKSMLAEASPGKKLKTSTHAVLVNKFTPNLLKPRTMKHFYRLSAHKQLDLSERNRASIGRRDWLYHR